MSSRARTTSAAPRSSSSDQPSENRLATEPSVPATLDDSPAASAQAATPPAATAQSIAKATSAVVSADQPDSSVKNHESGAAAPTASAAVAKASPALTTAAAGGSRRRSGFAVAADGATLFYEVMGRPLPATSILLCDGLGCDGYVWKYLQWVLAERYRILHFHYRGHGRTPLPADISR